MAEIKKNMTGPVLANAAPSATAASAAVVETMPVSAQATATLVPLTTPEPVKPDHAGFEALLASQSASAAKPEVNAAAPAVTATPNPVNGFYLQFGAFGLRSNAEATFTHLQNKLAQLPGFEIVQQGTLYRLFSGPFASRDEAQGAIELALNVGLPKPLIVQR